MRTTELRFTEEQENSIYIVSLVASDNGDTTMYIHNNAVLHIDKDDARMIVQFLKTTFNLCM